MNSGESESESSNSGSEDKSTIIHKILGEMKSEFNSPRADDAPNTNDEEKPRIILSFKKPASDESPPVGGRRSLRYKNPEEKPELKRSARRRSKDCSESVLQSAIARKEKSYNESNKPQRLTRQLKPTQKILENLALAKMEKSRFFECEESERLVRKHKHKHNKCRRLKRAKLGQGDSEKETDSDEGGCRRPRSENVDEGEELEGAKDTCLCRRRTKFFLATNEETAYCAAVDSIDDKLIGCGRTVATKDLMLLRPSTRVPYTIFCDLHKSRLLRHNCCPTCGIFCTQGRFVQCENKHQYHKDCQSEVDCCPHCGISGISYQVDIVMQLGKKPVFLPVQKAQYITARMTFSTLKTEESKCMTPPLIPIGSFEFDNSFEYGDEVYEMNELIVAVKNNALEKIATILGSKTLDVNSKIPECQDGTILHIAAEKGNVSIVHMLVVAGTQTDVYDKDQNTPLMAAVMAANNETVRYLIKTGADIHLKGTDGMTALHLAAKCGNLHACQLLVDNSPRKAVNCQDDGGWTPLVWACEHGYGDVATFLINKGADPSVRDVEHNVALHWAAFSGSCHIAGLLLDKGCDVNAVNAHGDTPLHIGARQDMYDCNVVLLARGADVTLLNKNNESPLDCVPAGGDTYSVIALNVTLGGAYNSQNVVLCNDITKGRESNPIQCYNSVDNATNPNDFKYVTKNCITSDDVKIEAKITDLQCCQCEERCVTDDCQCGKLSLRCWYDEEGKLIPEFNFGDIPMIFECNDRCQCNAITCNNRVVQKGPNQRFELFKTLDKGWGIRTLRPISRGSFICEYIGEIITDSEADKREDDSFLFDLENRVCKNEDVDSYCIDAKFYGNFARFINHSCNPNLTSVKVFIDHQDLRFPRIAFFANRDISNEEELSFDYGEKFWLAKYKLFSCLCGSLECKYSEDTIGMRT
ncbi:histone-lysine N-methyltransferase EHMT2 [Tribolium castaneum]|uniref:Histone-lysine N-methyltransferase EHMT1-like Protein n=1 Tax=Tribolium castaneum TaxID=7070 RepID=D6X453_TRICA|nr:PREDICTED: histone-lysine N-methyltransferase EHMT2 [Tribolium castaneum]EEZ97316.2 Histone-lysine N-methyltransferase EHMT1-like Protein [Tribolium castaneum]|eukprot:XP_008198704.1 PREDICTED: histone-lysine N-methyltransferase EHMT2 [Tribolium castaneum]